jgi:hypothetical protein
MKFRKGDICTIEVVVDGSPFADNDIRVRQPDKYGDLYVKQSDLTLVRPAFEVGDEVEWFAVEEDAGHGYRGHILSIANDHLWVDMGSGSFGTVWVGKAMRVDRDPEVVEAAPVEDAA